MILESCKTVRGIEKTYAFMYNWERKLEWMIAYRRKGMKYIEATSDMANGIYNVLHTAIKTIYPKYYPKEVVDFFCKHHNKEHILEGIASGNMGVLIYNDVVVGTGCFDGNHITGVYVLPFYQNQGCGSHIMNCLEKEIAKKYDTAILDASLPTVL